mmetsp:Transcript_32113/g.80774  ORF Transcript_32113/g.80774 Transcript_32113/m.80774 type:complete len:297 (-) Transcript_32113:91-981(-)
MGPSNPGQAKSMTAAYSSRLFCMGVPVSRTRRGTSTIRSAASVCEPCCALRSLCASSQISSSGLAPAAMGARRRSVSYDVTSNGQRSKALLVPGGAPRAHRLYASTASAPPPSARAACARTPPSHLAHSAPQDPTRDAGHTSSARVAVGTPRGPCRSMVHTSARDCSDLPRPMSSASRQPVLCGAWDWDWDRSAPRLSKPCSTRYIHRTPSRWCGRSFRAMKGSTTTATPPPLSLRESASTAEHNTSAPGASGSCSGLILPRAPSRVSAAWTPPSSSVCFTSSGVAGTTSPPGEVP